MLGKLTLRTWAASHRRLLIGLVVGLVVLACGTVGAFALDSSRSNQIASGITVGGIDIGGRSTQEAAATVRSQVNRPLQRPVTVTFSGVKYKVTAQELGLHADVNEIVAEAKDASRSHSLPVRVFHDIFGGGVNKDLDPKVTYSQSALDDYIKRVTDGVNRSARDASVSPGPDSVDPVKERDGVEVVQEELRQKVETALNDPVGGRRIHAPVDRTHAKVTIAQLASHYPAYITVDRGGFQLKFFRNLKLVKSYPIAVGMVGLETPAGLYHIQDKGVNVAWSVPKSAWAGDLAGKVIPGGAPNNPIKARWMGIFAGAGIHGTDELSSLGSAASHGCIRMAIPDVIQLYDQVSVGTPVYIGN